MKIGTATTDGINVVGDQTTAVSSLTVVHAPPVIPDLPVATVEVDGQTIYQKMYKNTDFEVPKEDSRGPFYVITKGYCIGIIDDWGVASDAVTGVGDATYCKVDTVHAGLAKILKAIDNKATLLIKK
ncbi:hypothetical protein V8E55_010499 [Tylopilus felleus]